MSADSESEGDSSSPVTVLTEKRPRRPSKYECPADFVSMCYKPCSKTLPDISCGNDKELWLIKAPASFNPRSLSGKKVPLSGLRMIQACGEGESQQTYRILAGSNGSNNLHLLTTNPGQPGACLCATGFCGILNICENYGGCSSNQELVAVPAAPPPHVPEGLRQRFQPFGGATPASAAFSSMVEPSGVVKSDPESGEESRKQTRKRKIKSEDVHYDQSQLTVSDGDVTEGKKQTKKKKKKKDKDRDVEESEELVPVVMNIKQESADADYALTDPPVKKKKKKKSKTD
ncbi:DNA-directed RNA polymerase I subunit RPA34 [Denticeps clupeoides]|uniref:DNA-directed RNA polymerase I subunit RPA34 n=1 Tax=Denticeps clupeoides TaxID=299321 RepID=UPI0010A3DDB7|nr:DNA-directed RNA polymerase I subunit RPA34-like [Denticeps clupeoides]